MKSEEKIVVTNLRAKPGKAKKIMHVLWVMLLMIYRDSISNSNIYKM